jgi:hypothetical protein
MDTDKRVIRFDSVSKSLAPGVRIGWITTTPEFISKYILLQECSTQVTLTFIPFDSCRLLTFLLPLLVGSFHQDFHNPFSLV